MKKLSYGRWNSLRGSLQRVGRRTSAKIRGFECLRFLSLCVLLISTASCVQPGGANDIQAATDAIRQQIAKYTAALDAADIALASKVWLTSPEVSFISPAGHQHGWEEVKGVYEFFGTSFSERKLTVRDVSVHVLGDSAWAEFYWHFVGKQRSDGAPIQTDGRETQVYRKVGERWMVVHVHYSGMPTVR